MQRSSETIGTIAAALAKAQAELVNPEKSLVATIRSTDAANPSEKSFRYAPLSTGLDIVRKTLSQHEIATVQTTSIDESAGIVRLSTVLAHASGEWIASDWPVCAISETATPDRMGAALTYARRYALFTLVGIAGEDDRDAPDLIAPTTPTSKEEGTAGNKKGHLNGGKGPRFSAERTRKAAPGLLEPAASRALRDQLLTELESLSSADEVTGWAHRVLSKKKTPLLKPMPLRSRKRSGPSWQRFRPNLKIRRSVPTNLSSVRRSEANGDDLLSTRASWYCRHRGGFAIVSMSNQLPSNHAWSADGVLPMLTI